MQIYDLSNLFHIAVHAAFENKVRQGKPDVAQNFVRHLMLNMIRASNVKFANTYGRIVLACDGKMSWRKKQFSFYKSHRQDDRDKQSHIDWPAMYALLEDFKQEMREYTDYIVIDVDSAEGDDVIAVLSIEYDRLYPNIIISKDHDFKQLIGYTYVKIYDPLKHEMVTVDDPYKYQEMHIIKGDVGDGIPNIMSDDDTFMIKEKRQKPMTAKRLEAFMEKHVSDWDNVVYQRNWHRNATLIDLRKTPKATKELIISQYEDQLDRSGKKLHKYFMKFRLAELMEKKNDF